MAMFEDVTGKAQVVSTGSTAARTESQGSTTSWSHDSAGKHMDAESSTAQSVHDDGHGHRSETFTKTTRTVTHDAKTHEVHTDLVSQSVTKDLAPGQAAVDLSKVLDEHSNGSAIPGLSYLNEHKQSHATEAGRVISEQTEGVAWDKVGNKSSYASGREGGGIGFSSHEENTSHSHGSNAGSSASAGISAGHSLSGSHGVAATYDESSTHSARIEGGRAERGEFSKPTGLSAHVSDSLVNHLVSRGYSASEAKSTVHEVSSTLSHELGNHAMGQAASVDFHKDGPWAVSLSRGTSASDSNTVSVPMDTLKAVHESGIAQNLDSVQRGQNAQIAQQASHEMSR